LVIERIRTRLNLGEPLKLAVDIGCGTGQSTTALLACARQVVGIDSSSEMLAHVNLSQGGLLLVHGRAEALPLGDDSVSLMTAAMAYHWFDRARFFEESARVLKPGGTLVIYNCSLLGRMKTNPEFGIWMREVYRRRYPSPARRRHVLAPADAGQFGLALCHHESFTSEMWLCRDELVDYLTTQSNVIARVEHGDESLGHARGWLLDSLAPFYRTRRENLVFRAEVWYLEREAQPTNKQAC
jgi:SAM-dependent methyltransferase